jgi:tRNA (cmo5U34)-methyltransferase
MLQRMVSFIPRDAGAAIRVLDIGGGYGLVSQQVLEAYPQATVVLHDYSEPMFGHSRQRLAWAGDRVSYVKADLFDPAWNQAFDGQFDAVVSAIAIHNIRSAERIHAIYREIFPLVCQGGCFLNYDRIPPVSALLAAVYHHAANRVMPAQGTRLSTRATHTEDPATLENQLRWLREAGFDVSDCLWKDLQVAIIGGFRS